MLRKPNKKKFFKTRHQIESKSHQAKQPISRRYCSAFPFKWYQVVLMLVILSVSSHVIVLDLDVRQQFEGKRWALPARVYARPLELYTGKRLTTTTLTEELKALGYQKVRPLSEPGQYYRQGHHFFIKTRTFNFWDTIELSRMVKISIQHHKVKSINELNPNRPLTLFRLPPKLIGKIYPSHHEDRILVTLDKVPSLLIDAVIAVEDRNFFNHYGISLQGLMRAIRVNAKAKKWVQGGSTITQQLVKNFYLTPERTFKRKFNEAIMALLLEWHYGKQQILEAYINEVYMGQDGDRAIHGMGQAARFYFGRPLTELKLPQLALLVALIRGPSFYSPHQSPKRALERRNLVLDMMAEQGTLSSDEVKLSKTAPLGITKDIIESKFPYPAFIELVRHQLHQTYDEKDLRSEGLQIFTTLDPSLQKFSERIVIKGLKKLERKTRQARRLEGVMIVTHVDNGEVLALVNSRKPDFPGFNRPLNAERQIGSLVKVAVYLTALENPKRYSLTTPISDAPYTWVNRYNGKVWKPKNYGRRSHGRVPLYKALAYSYNIATVRLGMRLGLKKVFNTLERLGIERESVLKKKYPAMLLGAMQLSPMEVIQMYQTIASGGFRVPVRAIREVLDHKGKPLQRYGLSMEQHFDEGSIFLLNYALQQVLSIGTARKVAKTLPKDMVLAGKTGTTNSLRDSWFAGFGSELLVLVWVGRDDNKPMGLSGGEGALVIWADFMRTFRPKSQVPTTPRNVKWHKTEEEQIPYIIR
jgi:penicillin-binding protein 1B